MAKDGILKDEMEFDAWFNSFVTKLETYKAKFGISDGKRILIILQSQPIPAGWFI